MFDKKENKKCVYCGSLNIREITKSGKTRVYKCNNCGEIETITE